MRPFVVLNLCVRFFLNSTFPSKDIRGEIGSFWASHFERSYPKFSTYISNLVNFQTCVKVCSLTFSDLCVNVLAKKKMRTLHGMG